MPTMEKRAKEENKEEKKHMKIINKKDNLESFVGLERERESISLFNMEFVCSTTHVI